VKYPAKCMKPFRLFFTLICALLFMIDSYAQEPDEAETEKMISQEIEALEKLFELDEIQLFYVDSILQHNVTALMDEINELRKGGAEYQESYIMVTDKWLDLTDKAFQTVFTEEQWKKYMKSNFGREKIKRDKRIAKRSNN